MSLFEDLAVQAKKDQEYCKSQILTLDRLLRKANDIMTANDQHCVTWVDNDITIQYTFDSDFVTADDNICTNEDSIFWLERVLRD